jgi:hypothetical protein
MATILTHAQPSFVIFHDGPFGSGRKLLCHFLEAVGLPLPACHSLSESGYVLQSFVMLSYTWWRLAV